MLGSALHAAGKAGSAFPIGKADLISARCQLGHLPRLASAGSLSSRALGWSKLHLKGRRQEGMPPMLRQYRPPDCCLSQSPLGRQTNNQHCLQEGRFSKRSRALQTRMLQHVGNETKHEGIIAVISPLMIMTEL